MEALKVSDAKLVVYVHPSKAKIISEAIARELSSLLFKFNESFEGVLLAYEVVDIDSNESAILPGLFPYFGVKLRANLLLFNPKPNTYLEGKVVRATRESIHLVVLGFSAAVITREDIRHEFKLKVKHGQEVFLSRSNKRHVIKPGATVRFLVKSFNDEMLHICGSLAPADTGNIRWLDQISEAAFNANRSSKKRRQSEGEKETEDLISDLDQDEACSAVSHVVKKAKRKNFGEMC